MKPQEFIERYKPFIYGEEELLKYETMSDAWYACKRPPWLFWVIEKMKPLTQVQAATLAIKFARSCADNCPEPSVINAIEAAQACLNNPSRSNVILAFEAARYVNYQCSYPDHATWLENSQKAAFNSAKVAALAATEAVCTDRIRIAARSAEDAATAAARSISRAAVVKSKARTNESARAVSTKAERSAMETQCFQIRELVGNPFD